VKCAVHRVAISAPDDVSGLRALLLRGELLASEVVAIMGKTEGNGCVNDHSRGLAVLALGAFFNEQIGHEAASKILLIMSGGTEGVLTPHLTVISRSSALAPFGNLGKALSVGIGRTPPLLPEHIGRLRQVELVAAATRTAVQDALLEDPADVHLIQVKCPLLTTESLQDAARRGAVTATDDTYKSMGYSRGASALGVGAALGEIDVSEIDESAICARWDRYSSVASTSAGNELQHCEVLVLGNSRLASGDLRIAHDVMRDAIDIEAVRSAAARAGYCDEPVELVQAFAKAEADPSGRIRQRRHTMLSDSDINHTRHARAVVGGVIASFFGDPMIYVSGGAEHQGPAGGGPVAVITRRVESRDRPGQ
jgi:cyanuric acid amidohydrolase